jgi:hypothetical protein
VKRIRLEVGAGELLDRLTIVELKHRHAGSDAQRVRIGRDVDRLRRACARAGLALTADPEIEALRSVNDALWTVEDELRACEARGDFGARFIELARSVYRHNDWRAAIKRNIDERHASAISEEKIYPSLTGGRIRT